MDYDPNRDGIDHINIWSKAQTETGRNLSNFANLPFTVPNYGLFNSVEGFWYWIQCYYLLEYEYPLDKSKVKELRKSYGFKAKQLGNSILKEYDKERKVVCSEATFRNHIIDALDAKIMAYSSLSRGLVDTTLPLTHYYVYGDKEPVVRIGSNQWIVEHLEDLRQELFRDYATAWVVRISIDNDIEDAFVLRGDSRDLQLDGVIKLLRYLKDGDSVSKHMEAIIELLKQSDLSDWVEKMDSTFYRYFTHGQEETIYFRKIDEVLVYQQNGVLISTFKP